jgi:N-acetylglutamate synthase-like GNAT family acetyltransferase
MPEEQKLVVRRAKPSDAQRIAEFVNRTQENIANVDAQAVITRLGNVGFLLAERDGVLCGLIGWQVENLVVRVTDFLIWPARERAAVSRALLFEMEEAAIELQCEAALLFAPQPILSDWIDFYEKFGYQPETVTSLSKAWREAAQEAGLGKDETIMVKKLRSERVIRPL